MADFNKILEDVREFNFNELDWDRVGVWPLYGRCILFLLAFVAVIVGAYFFLVKDKQLTLDQKKNQEASLRQSFEAKAFEAANLDALRQQMREMRQSFNVTVGQLPEDIEVPDLLEDIDSRVVESKLDINSIDPQEFVSKEFYIELPIQIELVGGYHEFGSFVSGIAGMSRIVTLHDFTINTAANSGNADRLTMSITAKTYKYKTQEQ